jgi:hypothetical protein
MNYPTLDQVEAAGHFQLGNWYRHLPSPGSNSIGNSDADFYADSTREMLIMNRIQQRFASMGGMNPKLSKQIAW